MTWTYERPPLVEVVCEFRFEAPEGWDWTVAGLLWERVQGEFPQKEMGQVGPPEIRALMPQAETVINRMIFRASEGSPLMQVGPDLLTVNSLSPYPGWEVFLPLAIRQFEAYRSVASVRRVKRLGLRYINRVRLPGTELELGQYFRAAPAIPDIGASFAGFTSVSSLAWPDSQVAMRFRLGTTNEDSEAASAFMLDLDAFMLDLDPDTGQIRAALDEMHEVVERAFTAALTDLTHRDVLGGTPT